MNPDWKILKLARKGNQDAWQELVNRVTPDLIRLAFMITGSVDTARDLAQDTLYELLRNKPPHARGSFKGYISTIVYHKSLKEKTRGKRSESLPNEEPWGHTETPLQYVLREERDRLLYIVIQSLEDIHREVVVLRFYGHHSYHEISEILSVPLGTVKSRINTAVSLCREKMHRKGLL